MKQNKKTKKKELGPSTKEMDIFDRPVIQARRDRVAHHFKQHDFLVNEIGSRLVDNLFDIKRLFKQVLCMNLPDNLLHKTFQEGYIVNQDLSYQMLKGRKNLSVQADEEFFPFKNKSFDLIASCLTLHWVNDMPGCLSQFLHGLRPDGLMLAAFFGGETLFELRDVLMKAELELRGGASPHISPFVDIRDAGALLQRAGFAMPVANIERITVTYSDAMALMRELKAMGETNGLIRRSPGLTSPRLMMKAAEYYHRIYADDRGRIPATFDVIYLQGWAPHENQQKPLKPGSAKMSLKDALASMPPKS